MRSVLASVLLILCVAQGIKSSPITQISEDDLPVKSENKLLENVIIVKSYQGLSASNSQSIRLNPNKLCTKSGYVRDPSDCSVFYYCLDNNGNFVALKQTCSSGLYFDEILLQCNYPSEVECSICS